MQTEVRKKMNIPGRRRNGSVRGTSHILWRCLSISSKTGERWPSDQVSTFPCDNQSLYLSTGSDVSRLHDFSITFGLARLAYFFSAKETMFIYVYSNCWRDYLKTTDHIFIKLYGKAGYNPGTSHYI